MLIAIQEKKNNVQREIILSHDNKYHDSQVIEDRLEVCWGRSWLS